MIKKLDKIFFICGIVMICSEIWKQWVLTGLNGGQYDWWYFPFQLCSLPMYLLALIPIARNSGVRRSIYTFLMDYCMICGIFVFFDISGMIYPTLSLTIHSFSWHIVLLGLGITAGISGSADYTFKGFLKGSAIFWGGCIIAELFNFFFHRLGSINMFYISPYFQMDQMVFRFFARNFGNLVGIIIYIAAITLGAFLFHKLWGIAGARRNQSRQPEE